MHLKYRKTCRVCGSSELTPVIDLGLQTNQGAFISPDGAVPSTRKVPMRLVRCDPMKDEGSCGLLQTACAIPPEILYSTYWYRSGVNQTMRDHLCGIAEEAMALVEVERARVLDIGCNDGTLLSYYPAAYERVGIDPSNAVADVPEGIRVIQDSFPSPELSAVAASGDFNVVTTIAMFYDLEDPVGFAREVKNLLIPDGIWIFEMSYMPSMLEANSYDTICHEHLEYYSLAVLERIVEDADLRIFNVSLNASNGGSIRCYATHSTNFGHRSPTYDHNLEQLRVREFDLELDTDKPYRDFQQQIDAHTSALSSLIKTLKREGNSIHVYGASTKGNTILQACGLDNTLIDYAADRNPLKQGGRTLGSNIPIISEEESRAMKPDYFLVLPWHFRSEFLEREKDTLQAGVAMIFPLPKVEIIRADGSY